MQLLMSFHVYNGPRQLILSSPVLPCVSRVAVCFSHSFWFSEDVAGVTDHMTNRGRYNVTCDASFGKRLLIKPHYEN